MVLYEHWLWPYELHMLKEIHPDFTAVAVSDDRLSATSDLIRGCGGVTILWHNFLTIDRPSTPNRTVCVLYE